MLKTKSTTETMGSSEISDQNDGLEGFNELEPTLPPRRKGSLRKAALEAAAEHGERDEDAPKRKRGRPRKVTSTPAHPAANADDEGAAN